MERRASGLTDKEYKTVVKLLIEELEKCRDEIFEKQAEIERLKDMVAQNEGVLPRYEHLIKSEAIKEFAERLVLVEETTAINCATNEKVVRVTDIDNLVKEMVGDT